MAKIFSTVFDLETQSLPSASVPPFSIYVFALLRFSRQPLIQWLFASSFPSKGNKNSEKVNWWESCEDYGDQV